MKSFGEYLQRTIAFWLRRMTAMGDNGAAPTSLLTQPSYVLRMAGAVTLFTQRRAEYVVDRAPRRHYVTATKCLTLHLKYTHAEYFVSWIWLRCWSLSHIKTNVSLENETYLPLFKRETLEKYVFESINLITTLYRCFLNFYVPRGMKLCNVNKSKIVILTNRK